MAEGGQDNQGLPLFINQDISQTIKSSMDIIYQNPLPMDFEQNLKRKKDVTEDESEARNTSKQNENIVTNRITEIGYSDNHNHPLSYITNVNVNQALLYPTNVNVNQSLSYTKNDNNNLNQSSPHPNNNQMNSLSQPSSFALKCKQNRYSSHDNGPYSLYVESFDQTRIHAMSIGKIIRINNFNIYSKIDAIKNIGRNRVKLTINCTFEEANSLIEQDIWGLNKLSCFIPSFLLVKQGVIRDVDTSLTKEEIIRYAQSQYEIVDAVRINKLKQGEGKGEIRVPTPVVIISFRSQRLPYDVRILGVRCIVESYIQRVQQCRKCLRYGHSSQVCKNNRRCENCANAHETNECPNETICVFCSGLHKSTDFKNCPEYARQREIKNLMAMNNVSFAEANQTLRAKYRGKIPYINSSPPPFQFPPSQEEFPALPEMPHSHLEKMNQSYCSQNRNIDTLQQGQYNKSKATHSKSSPNITTNKYFPSQANISNSLNIPSTNILDSSNYKKNIDIDNLKGIIMEVINKIISISCPSPFIKEMTSSQNQILIAKYLSESLHSLFTAVNNSSSSDEEL